MSRLVHYIITLVLLQSCASVPHERFAEIPSPDLGKLFPAVPAGKYVVMTGKVRLELPKYRVRGTCRIIYGPEGEMQLDFLHSSLFGSYREEATIYIDDTGMVLYDHQRDVLWDSDSTLALLERHFGFRVYPDDILFILLLMYPDLYYMSYVTDSREWHVAGKWRGREVRIRGESGKGPLEFDLCDEVTDVCYRARYRYAESRVFGWYPEKIVFKSKYGTERFSLTLTGLTEEDIVKTDIE